MPISDQQLDELRRLAKAAAANAYAPYSRFRVGAALLSAGKIFTGCNVENASYGLTNCAERTAIFTMAAAGGTSFEAIVVYTPTPQPTPPCGACRQVLFEFNPSAEVISICDGENVILTTVSALLPGAFGPRSL